MYGVEVQQRNPLKMIANPRIVPSSTSTSSSEQETAPPTTSHDQRVEDSPESENAAAEGPAMKLVVRSSYWGRILKGKARRTVDYGGLPGRQYRVIGCQAVLSAVDGQYWGCCPHHGKRVLELKEHHFLDQYTGNWDLFAVPPVSTPAYMVHGFFLLPQNQNVIDVAYKVATEGWSFVGTANASVVRMDLEAMLSDILKQNDGVGFKYHHVHLEILMDQVFDRETPRSRKAAIDKSRSERGTSSNSSIVTPHSDQTGGDTSSVATPPSSIPHVVSNDASWFSDGTHSTYASATTSHHLDSMPHGWSYGGGAQHFHPHHHYQSYPPHWANPDYVPMFRSHTHGAGGSMTSILPPMNPAQQLLHQGYTAGSNTVLPPAFMPHEAALEHFRTHSGFVPGHYSTLPPSNLQRQHQYTTPSPWTTPEEEEDRDDGNDANDRTGTHQLADEKLSEDVATASFSETTAEEEDEDHHSADVQPEPELS